MRGNASRPRQDYATVSVPNMTGRFNNMDPNARLKPSSQTVKRGLNKLNIRDLNASERESYVAQWQTVQSRFVDFPKGAVTEADELVCSLMKARGYPVTDFDQQAADISVDHPRVVENYRSGHNVALRLGRGEASTEDLRNAMIHYRSLFDELVQVQIVGEKRVA